MQKAGTGSAFRWLFFGILFMLYGILIIQYLHNRSLWNDEAMLSLNILNRNFSGLFKPLDYYQIAPVLFLQIEKSATILFGNSELSLRMFPLISGLLCLPLFYGLCLQLTGNRILSLSAMVLLGCTPGFVYYSSEVKQYCTDIFVLLLLYNAAFHHSSGLNKWRWLVLMVAGVVAVFLSNVSIIILFTLGLYFVYRSWKTKKILFEYWAPAVAWAISFAINFLLFVKDHPHAAYMKKYWQYSFMPVNIAGGDFRQFMSRSLYHIFYDLLPSFPWSYLYIISVILFAAGLLIMLRQKRLLLLYLCAAPVCIHLALSALQIYPFEQRLVLYQAPLYIFSITYALVFIFTKLIHHSGIRIAIIGSFVILLSVKTFIPFPKEHDEIKPAIQYINDHYKPGEFLYVFKGGTPATRYYMQTGLAAFKDLSITWGKERLTGINDYLADLNQIHGNTWLLVSHIYPFNGDRREELELMRELSLQGQLMNHKDFNGSSVYLFKK